MEWRGFMGKELLKVLGELTIFMLCAQTLLQFKPREDYDKYLRLLLNLLILLLLLEPLRTLFTGTGQDKLKQERAILEQRLEETLWKGVAWETDGLSGDMMAEPGEIHIEKVVVEYVQVGQRQGKEGLGGSAQ